MCNPTGIKRFPTQATDAMRNGAAANDCHAG